MFSSLGFLLPFRLPFLRIWKPTKTQKRKDRKYEEVTEIFLQVFFRLEDFPPGAREESFPEPSQGDRTRDHVLGEKLKKIDKDKDKNKVKYKDKDKDKASQSPARAIGQETTSLVRS